MKFKDVAHLYLPFLAIVDDRSYMVHGYSIDEDMFQVDIDETTQDWWNTCNFKPVLKSLGDFTAGEIANAIEPMTYGLKSLNGKELHLQAAELTKYFLNAGYDLFGLIESGEAVDVKSLTKS